MEKLLLILLCCSVGASIRANNEICISSVADNSITYEISGNSSKIEKQLFSIKDLENIQGMLGIVVNLTTTNISERNDIDINYELFFATRTPLLLALEAETFDSLTFAALSYSERTTTVSLTILTSNSCSGAGIRESSEDDDGKQTLLVLKSILAPLRLHYIKSLGGSMPPTSSLSEDLLSAIQSSSTMLFLSVSVFSLLTVFLALPTLVKHFATSSSLRQPYNYNTRTNPSANEHTMLIGIYIVSMFYTIGYVAYWIVQINDFVVQIKAASTMSTSVIDNSLAKINLMNSTPVLSSFAVNCLVMLLMTITSIVTTIVIGIRQTKPTSSFRKSKLILKLFIYAGSSCLVTLLTCMVYHGFFTAIAMAIDFTTTLTELTYMATLIIAIYCSVPVLLKQFYSTKRNREYAKFLLLSLLLLIILIFYCLLVSSLNSLMGQSSAANPTYEHTLPELVATIIASACTLTLFIVIEEGVGTNVVKKASRMSTRNNDNNGDVIDQTKPIKKLDKMKLANGRSIPQLMYVMISNPGSVLAMVQHHHPTSPKAAGALDKV